MLGMVPLHQGFLMHRKTQMSPASGDWVRSSQTISSSQILGPVREDMEQMTENLKNIVGNRHPLLLAAAEQIFGAGGKKLRPAIVFLVARGNCRAWWSQAGPFCTKCQTHTSCIFHELIPTTHGLRTLTSQDAFCCDNY